MRRSLALSRCAKTVSPSQSSPHEPPEGRPTKVVQHLGHVLPSDQAITVSIQHLKRFPQFPDRDRVRPAEPMATLGLPLDWTGWAAER